MSVPVQLDIIIVSSPICCLDYEQSNTLARGLHKGQSSRSRTEQRHRESTENLIGQKDDTYLCMGICMPTHSISVKPQTTQVDVECVPHGWFCG